MTDVTLAQLMPAAAPPTPRQADPAINKAIAALVGLRSNRQQRFVHHYLQLIATGRESGAEAARLAGYAPAHAKQEALRLLKMPLIKAVIDAVYVATATTTVYTQAEAMRKLDEVVAHAIATQNASAHCRAIELQARIAGVLVDRIDARVAVGTFQLNVIGLDAGNG